MATATVCLISFLLAGIIVLVILVIISKDFFESLELDRKFLITSISAGGIARDPFDGLRCYNLLIDIGGRKRKEVRKTRVVPWREIKRLGKGELSYIKMVADQFGNRHIRFYLNPEDMEKKDLLEVE